MRAAAWLMAFAFLTGCARQPLLPAEQQCAAPEPDTLLVRAGKAGSLDTRLVIRSERHGGERVFVALDMLGSPLFSGREDGGVLTVRSTGLYQGPDATLLLQGLGWWQIRDQINAQCTRASGLEIVRDNNTLSLYRGRSLVWQWRADQANRFHLPAAGISARVDKASP